MKLLLLSLSLLIPTIGLAQSYSIDWSKISGGGGTSTGGVYAVSGTIGQPDASSAMTGGNYSLTGGFWSLIQVVQTPGAPTLSIAYSGNAVIISWADPATNTYTLLQNSDLANAGGWTTNRLPVLSADGTNSIVTNSPKANLFFRLKKP
jgi:hypothetical protein